MDCGTEFVIFLFRICLLFGSWVRCCLNRDLMTEGPDGMLYPKLIELLDRMAKQSIRSQMAVNRVKLAILRVRPPYCVHYIVLLSLTRPPRRPNPNLLSLQRRTKRRKSEGNEKPRLLRIFRHLLLHILTSIMVRVV